MAVNYLNEPVYLPGQRGAPPRPAPAAVQPPMADGDADQGGSGGFFRRFGPARDILGIIGDALLVQSGNDRFYAPRKERHLAGQALQDYGEDPETAIRNYMAFDPAGAVEMFRNLGADRRAQATARRENRTADVDFSDRLNELGARAYAGVTDQASLDAANDRIRSLYISNDLEPPDLPDTYSPGAITAFRERALSVDDQFSHSRDDALADSLIADRETDNERAERLAASLIDDRLADNTRADQRLSLDTEESMFDRRRDLRRDRVDIADRRFDNRRQAYDSRTRRQRAENAGRRTGRRTGSVGRGPITRNGRTADGVFEYTLDPRTNRWVKGRRVGD